MRYVLAILLPPIAVMLSGGLAGALFSWGLYALAWLCLFSGFMSPVSPLLYIGCLIHALFEVQKYYTDRRAAELHQVIAASQAAAAQVVAQAIQQAAPGPLPVPTTIKPPQGYDAKTGTWIID